MALSRDILVPKQLTLSVPQALNKSGEVSNSVILSEPSLMALAICSLVGSQPVVIDEEDDSSLSFLYHICHLAVGFSSFNALSLSTPLHFFLSLPFSFSFFPFPFLFFLLLFPYLLILPGSGRADVPPFLPKRQDL
jgi:hypothetical protein